MVFIAFSTSLSKHLVMTGVSATGVSSFRVLVLLCLDTSTAVAELRQAGTLACVRNRLKMSIMLAPVVFEAQNDRAPLVLLRMYCCQWVSGRRAST